MRAKLGLRCVELFLKNDHIRGLSRRTKDTVKPVTPTPDTRQYAVPYKRPDHTIAIATVERLPDEKFPHIDSGLEIIRRLLRGLLH